jgi:superfamily II DNA or RNA helicase
MNTGIAYKHKTKKMENLKREQIQNEAKAKLKLFGYNGTVILDTGVGKTKVAIDCIKEGSFKNILITSPRTNLKENWKKELSKWGWEEWDNGIWVKDYDGEQPTRHIHITFENIQTAYKWKSGHTKLNKIHFDLIIADEIHTMMTPEYGALLERASELKVSIIGLTATPDDDKDDKSLLYEN